jgi:hypothetical protein
MYPIQNASYNDIVTILNCSLKIGIDKRVDLQAGTQQSAISKRKLVYEHTDFNNAIEHLIIALDKQEKGAKAK